MPPQSWALRVAPSAAWVISPDWNASLALPLTRRWFNGSSRDLTLEPIGVLEYIIPVDVTFYTLMVAAVILLRFKLPNAPRPYRTVAYPLPPLIYIGLAVLLVCDFVYLNPGTSGIGFLIVLAGIPVYLIWSRLGVGTGDRDVRPAASERRS